MPKQAAHPDPRKVRLVWVRPWLAWQVDAFGKHRVSCFWCGGLLAPDDVIERARRNGIPVVWYHEPRSRNGVARDIREHKECAPFPRELAALTAGGYDP